MFDYKQVLDAAPVATCMHEPGGAIMSANPAFCRLLGYAETELLQMPVWQLMPKEEKQTRREAMLQLLNGVASAQADESQYLHKAGHTLWLVENRTLVRDTKARPQYFICQYHDVTRRKENEQRLQLTRERYNLSQRHAGFGVWDWNIRTNELYWSEQIGPLLGYAEGEIAANYADFMAAIHADDREYMAEAVRAAVEDGADYDIEHRVVWPDGTVRWHRVTGDVIRDTNGAPLNMIGVARDITRHRHAEEALKQKAEQLNHAQQIAHLGHWSWDVKSGQLFWSDEIYRIFGYQPGEIAPTHEKFIATLHPDDVARIIRSEEEAFAEGRPYSIDHRIIRLDGSQAWVHEEAVAVTDEHGQPIRLTGTVQDITERKRLEQQLADKIEQAELANFAKSTFLTHMSHELRTPLNAILGFAQIMQMEDLPASIAGHVNEIMGSGWHLLDLVDDLLDLSRIETGDIELHIAAVEVKGLLEECQSMITPLLRGRRLTFIPSYRDCRYSVSADRQRLKQVIVNLLSNAIKYNRTNGELEVTCNRRGGRLRITVRDTGKGIPAELLPRLFTPFDRLGKEGIEGSGSGIGLALVKRLTHKMGGEVGVDSMMDVGSRFWVEFELAETSASDTQERRNNDRARQQAADRPAMRVLCVEDNLANMRLIEGFFSRQDQLELLTATNAASGLEMAQIYKPDVILMDIKLPDMNGFEALARLRSLPATNHIPVIAVSAIAREHDIAAGLNAGFYRYLTKPLKLQELEEAIYYARQDSLKTGPAI